MLPNDPTGFAPFLYRLSLNDPKRETESYIAEQREQLWAEALFRFRKGERAGLPFELRAEASKIAEQHRSTDEIIEDQIKVLPETLRTGASLQEITENMGYDGLVSRAEAMRVSTALRNLGWTKQRRFLRGKQQGVWSLI